MRRLALLGVVAVMAIALGPIACRDLRGLALVVRAGDLHGTVRRLADFDRVPIDERIVNLPVRGASIRARVFAPRRTPRHTALLVSGLHSDGIDEPRLIDLSRRLAEANVTVVTPEIPELSRFEVTPLLTDRIEDAAVWLATQSGLAPAGRIGLMGVSFSGGLAVVAAGRPSLRNRLLYVLSFGGHDDLQRVLDYFCAGDECFGTAQVAPPHDYGLAVVLLNVAEQVVPSTQIGGLREGIRRFLEASCLDRTDKGRAQGEFERLRDLARTLPEPSATLLGYVSARDVAHLGPWLKPYVAAYAETPALSPRRSPPPAAPVFLLHGRADNVIPAQESQHLAGRLRGQVPVRILLTDLVSHAEADQPARVADVWRLAQFWGAVLAR